MNPVNARQIYADKTNRLVSQYSVYRRRVGDRRADNENTPEFRAYEAGMRMALQELNANLASPRQFGKNGTMFAAFSAVPQQVTVTKAPKDLTAITAKIAATKAAKQEAKVAKQEAKALGRLTRSPKTPKAKPVVNSGPLVVGGPSGATDHPLDDWSQPGGVPGGISMEGGGGYDGYGQAGDANQDNLSDDSHPPVTQPATVSKPFNFGSLLIPAAMAILSFSELPMKSRHVNVKRVLRKEARYQRRHPSLQLLPEIGNPSQLQEAFPEGTVLGVLEPGQVMTDTSPSLPSSDYSLLFPYMAPKSPLPDRSGSFSGYHIRRSKRQPMTGVVQTDDGPVLVASASYSGPKKAVMPHLNLRRQKTVFAPRRGRVFASQVQPFSQWASIIGGIVGAATQVGTAVLTSKLTGGSSGGGGKNTGGSTYIPPAPVAVAKDNTGLYVMGGVGALALVLLMTRK